MICTCGNEHHSRVCLLGQLDGTQAERDKALARVEELERELAEARTTMFNYMAQLQRAQTAIALEDAWLRLEDASDALGAHNDACRECEEHADRGNCAEGCRLDAELADLDDEYRKAIAASRAAREAREKEHKRWIEEPGLYPVNDPNPDRDESPDGYEPEES